ncbi:FAD:protein FMN transferase [Schaalia cardiffensis]|uniref:FAD:protein FMN transferase n=1 Tax=Schaalia cardiffensis TaxID=181487 RepID=UPI002AB0C35A|nr:FAD:protein FMN transferase [Schaalia cardiffensis]
MGTRVDIIGHGGDLREITSQSCVLLAELESLWSVFRPDSDVSRINEGDSWCEIDERSDALLQDALALSEACGGAFNPLIGQMGELWDVKGWRRALVEGRPLPSPPSEEVLASVRACAAEPGLERDDAGRWRLRRGRAKNLPAFRRGPIDLGGIAKGAGADELRDAAVRLGAEGVLVSMGTSSIAVHGHRADGGEWRVGLRDPDGAENEWIGRVMLKGGALSTSGACGPRLLAPRAGQASEAGQGAEVHQGREAGQGAEARRADHVSEERSGALLRDPRIWGHHILDPRTGSPAVPRLRQAAVMCESGVMAEALSTALIVGGVECIDEEKLREWAHRRGVSSEWEWVVVGEETISSPAAGWIPKEESAGVSSLER